MTHLVPQLPFVGVGTFCCLYLSWSISELTFLAWAATVRTGDNTASITEKWAERLICFCMCLFPVSIHAFSFHGRSFPPNLAVRAMGTPTTAFFSPLWGVWLPVIKASSDIRQPCHLGSDCCERSCERAVRSSVGSLSWLRSWISVQSLVGIEPLHSPQIHFRHTKGYL